MKEIKIVNIEDIKPYKKNARINNKTIEKLKKSIELYGFNQPIIVDKDYVIIAGHARYMALKELNYKEVYCIIEDQMTEKQIKEYRIADNKTSEFSSWNMNELITELKETNIENIKEFFNENEINNINSSIGAPILQGTNIEGINIEETYKEARGQNGPLPLYKETYKPITQENILEIEERQEQSDKPWLGPSFVNNNKDEKYITIQCNHCGKTFMLIKHDIKTRINKWLEEQ